MLGSKMGVIWERLNGGTVVEWCHHGLLGVLAGEGVGRGGR
jgi:hypothetical protein